MSISTRDTEVAGKLIGRRAFIRSALFYSTASCAVLSAPSVALAGLRLSNNIEDLVRSALERAGISPQNALELTKEDFRKGRIVHIDGWAVSRTEATLFHAKYV